MQVTADGSAIANDGKILHFSIKRFISDICEGDACFICGRTRQQTDFNDEHILPNWLLRRYNLHSLSITLPNDQVHRYGTYTIPCCTECNSFMGHNLEAPMVEALSNGEEGILEYLHTHGPQHIFIWMATIFLKIHLKDNILRNHLDHREGDNSIAQENEYEWNIFHHLHTIVRSSYVGSTIAPQCIGSLWVQKIDNTDSASRFDLVDFSLAHTMMIRLDSVAIFAVFDDAKASAIGLKDLLEELPIVISSTQARELVAHMACCNLHLINRPNFYTRITNGRVFLEAQLDESPNFSQRDHELFGRIFRRAMTGVPLHLEGSTSEELDRMIGNGEFTILLNPDGSYRQPHRIMRVTDEDVVVNQRGRDNT